MYTLHCTAKLRERLQQPLGAGLSASTTLLGDWYATVVFWRPHAALFVNERTLMPVLLPFAPAKSLSVRLATAIGLLLRDYGAPSHIIERELAAMADVAIAKTSNRRVVGTMNEFIFEASHFRAASQPVDLSMLAARLSRTPCGAINHDFPDRLLREVISTGYQ